MMKPVTPQLRAAAAHVCAIAASTRGMNSYDVAKQLGRRSRSRTAWLARRAIGHTHLWYQHVYLGVRPRDRQSALYAHAEALLRTGWSP